MNTQPFDVVIPAYNAQEYISQAIRSCLDDRVGRIVVVDDKSADDTPSVVRGISDSRVVYIRHKYNCGQYVASNTAFQYLRPEALYIAMLDSDDVSHSDRFKLTQEFFEDHEDVDIVSGSMRRIDENGALIPGATHENPVDPHTVLCRTPGHVLTNGVMSIRRKVLDVLGGYEPGYGGQDTQFVTRAHFAGLKMRNMPAVLGYRRHHKNNVTKGANTDPLRKAYRQLYSAQYTYYSQLQRRGRLQSHYLKQEPIVGLIDEERTQGVTNAVASESESGKS